MHVKCKFNAFVTYKRYCSSYSKSFNPNALYHWNTKITKCFKCGDIKTAVQLFDKIPHKNVVTWNCMVSGYVRNGKILEARKVFDEMPQRNVVSWTAMLTGYAKYGNVEEARSLFDAISSKNVVCWNSMISGYVMRGRMCEARALFDAMPVKNEVTWVTMIEGYFSQGYVSEAEMLFGQVHVKSVSVCNAMLSGYADNGDVEASLKLFMSMPQRDVASWTNVIACFLSAGQLEKARALFDEMPKKDVVVWTVMIRGYFRSNMIEEARKLFDKMPRRDSVAWNSMIGGYVQNGSMENALELFMKMPRRNIVSWNLVLQGYVQDNDMVRAREFLEEMPQKDETSWNIIISGYQCEEALVLYVKMLKTGLVPNQGTFTTVISACGALAVHGLGRAMHTCAIKLGYENDISVISSVITMYSKCGFLDDASLVFGTMKTKDTVAWNAIIVGQAYHGSAVKSFQLFEYMIKDGFVPDHVTFLGLLAAGAHSGLVDESWRYFRSMERDWKLIPRAEHYACMIDILGKAGLLAEAYELVKQMPIDLPAYPWETLLSYCRVHNNFEIGECVMQKLLGSKTLSTGMSVLVSNMYVARGMWHDAENIRTSIKDRGLKKELACSWIEMKGQVYKFVCRDESHPQMENIRKEMESLTLIMEEFGPVMNL